MGKSDNNDPRNDGWRTRKCSLWKLWQPEWIHDNCALEQFGPMEVVCWGCPIGSHERNAQFGGVGIEWGLSAGWRSHDL